MGIIQKPLETKLFAAVMYAQPFDLQSCLRQLVSSYGEIERFYGPLFFSWSDYYEGEMGCNLLKYYAVFKEPFDRSRLAAVKNHTNELEKIFSQDGKRVVNIDPGYLAKDKLVLASTKDFYHRLYLGDGIFGEVTLHFRKGIFRYFSWTYPDYQEPTFLEFLKTARSDLAGETE
ncbi:MAG: DUF4416 family protein [Chitinispirillales bacterium]|jgi:hypothetical protein|nr:DUF4416 family protein [Chitinispirillales bacterium]